MHRGSGSKHKGAHSNRIKKKQEEPKAHGGKAQNPHKQVDPDHQVALEALD